MVLGSRPATKRDRPLELPLNEYEVLNAVGGEVEIDQVVVEGLNDRTPDLALVKASPIRRWMTPSAVEETFCTLLP